MSDDGGDDPHVLVDQLLASAERTAEIAAFHHARNQRLAAEVYEREAAILRRAVAFLRRFYPELTARELFEQGYRQVSRSACHVAKPGWRLGVSFAVSRATLDELRSLVWGKHWRNP